MRGRNTVRVTKVNGHADEGMVRECGLMRRLILVDGELIFLLLMLDATLRGFCGRWYPVVLELHRFLWLFRVLWLIMMMVMVLRLIRWSGLLVRYPRVGREERGRAMLLGPASLWRSVWVNLPSTAVLLGMWEHGHIGQLLGILGSVVFHVLRCLFCTSLGLVKGLS